MSASSLGWLEMALVQGSDSEFHLPQFLVYIEDLIYHLQAMKHLPKRLYWFILDAKQKSNMYLYIK